MVRVKFEPNSVTFPHVLSDGKSLAVSLHMPWKIAKIAATNKFYGQLETAMAVWAVNIPATGDSAYWEHFAQQARRIAVDVNLTRST